MRLEKITIKRFRSIRNLKIGFQKGKPLIICGPNNVGKTNFLRALDLFFSLNPEKINVKDDIPYDIEEGTRGGGRNIRFESVFSDEKSRKKIKINLIYKISKDRGKFMEIFAKEGAIDIKEAKAKEIISNFRFFFIEASNINMPLLIAQLVNEDILPELDKLRSKQSKPLNHLNQFISESENAVSGIEKNISVHLSDFVGDIPGIDIKDWEIKILFPEYLKLRDAISGLIDFTLYDKSKRKIGTKGSGIQRVLLLSIIKYISEKYNENVIFGIDEPEAFLQPSLQKKVFNIFNDLSKKIDVIVATHSPHFVDIENDANLYLFESKYEKRPLVRRKNEEFYKIKTIINNLKGVDKIQAIKEQLGIQRNDSWEILKYNVIVEGQDDKDYLIVLMKKFGLPIPNILIAGGVTKIKGFLQFLENFCDDIKFIPKVLCIIDHDEEGKKEFKFLNSKKDKYKKFKLYPIFIERCDGKKDNKFDYEVEDFIYPEIILKSINKILRKKKYNIITVGKIKQKFDQAYNKTCILDFFSEQIRLKNSTKNKIPLCENGFKKLICRNAVDIMNKEDIIEYNKKYPKIKEFIEYINSENNFR